MTTTQPGGHSGPYGEGGGEQPAESQQPAGQVQHDYGQNPATLGGHYWKILNEKYIVESVFALRFLEIVSPKNHENSHHFIHWYCLLVALTIAKNEPKHRIFGTIEGTAILTLPAKKRIFAPFLGI